MIHRSALVVAGTGPLREGLAALLSSIPLLGAVHQAGDLPSALTAIAQHRPSFVLVDGDLPAGEAWTLVREVEAHWPQTRCVLLTETTDPALRAGTAGASQVLVKGYPAAKLTGVLERLLA